MCTCLRIAARRASTFLGVTINWTRCREQSLIAFGIYVWNWGRYLIWRRHKARNASYHITKNYQPSPFTRILRKYIYRCSSLLLGMSQNKRWGGMGSSSREMAIDYWGLVLVNTFSRRYYQSINSERTVTYIVSTFYTTTPCSICRKVLL